MISITYLKLMGKGVLLVTWETDKPIVFSTNREIKSVPLHLGNINLPTLKCPATFLSTDDGKEGIAIAVTQGRVQLRHMRMLLLLCELRHRIDKAQTDAAMNELNQLYPDAI
jgi:hypothetical protein